MAAFVALCEGFLGTDAHFDLLNYFFKASLVRSSSIISPVGFCSIQMKQLQISQFPQLELF